MPQPACKRCRQLLIPIYPGQEEHPMCSPADTGWIPRPRDSRQDELTAAGPATAPGRRSGRQPHGLTVALGLAALGWHIFPLSAATKGPLGNCPACRDTGTNPPHRIEACPCIPAGRWCHGVRAATTDPGRLAAWWRDEPAAVPGVAAGPSGLVLIDIDAHGEELPANMATGLLPGIDLTAESLSRELWDDPGRFRDGRQSLSLLAAIRGGTQPWPADPACQPVTVATPSSGRHLWYRAPAPGLRQALSSPRGLAWQVDVKAGWSHGLAPGAAAERGAYRVLAGDPASPGTMPGWLADEVVRVASPKSPDPQRSPAAAPALGRRGAAYVTTIITRGAAELADMCDGRKRALAKLAYHVGGLLDWSGLAHQHVADWLSEAGTASGLDSGTARRIVARSLTRGLADPIARRRRLPVSQLSHPTNRTPLNKQSQLSNGITSGLSVGGTLHEHVRNDRFSRSPHG